MEKFHQLFIILLIVSLTLGCSREDKKLRILTGGIRHESNTFSTLLTSEEDFHVEQGQEVLKDKEWASLLQDSGAEVIPTLHAYASPFGVVKQEVYEKFRDEILEGARNAGEVDGVFLDMHGALHAEGYADAQLDLVTRLREILGDVPISASFDLHGNISSEFAQQLDIMTAYRTAPHVDGAETRTRAVRLLLNVLEKNDQPAVAHINIPIIIPGEKGITSVEPLKSLYGRLDDIAQIEGLLDASIFVGMPWTDVGRAGMSAQVVASDSSYLPQARVALEQLAGEIWEKRSGLKFDVPVMDIDKAIETAQQRPESTVFITDSGDNTTAGAAGDNTLVLERLLAHSVGDAVFAGVVDPKAVAACEEAGVGAQVDLTVGGKMDTVFGEPLRINGEVIFLTDESERNTDKQSAVVKVDNVLVVLLGVRRSFTAPSDFEEVGIDPLNHKIVVTKLGYLFAGLREIAPYTIMALTPGFANQAVENLEYQNIHRPIYPIDPEMSWEPELTN